MKLTKLLMAMLLVLSTFTYSQEEEMVNINFRDLEMKDFIEMVSKITKKNILIEGDLKGKINFVSQTPLKKSSLIPLANSILVSKNLTIVDQGDYYKVVRVNDAPGEGLNISDNFEGETLKTVMFPLQNSNAAVVRAKIKTLLSKNSSVISFKENNVLAITAEPRTLRAISKVLKAIESKGEKHSVVIKLKNSTVKDIFPNAQNMAKKIFPQTIESEKVDIFKDEATNSIILVGKKENNNKMIKYIKKLDIKGESTTQQMYVIRLKNSNVEEMEKIMSKLISQMNNIATKQPAKGAQAPSKAMVVSDVERNALILLATAEQMKNIRDTIKRIDIPKVQVYVKAKIVEVNNNLAQQLGLKYGLNGGQITSNGLFTLSTNTGGSAMQMSSDLLSFLNQNSTTTNVVDGVVVTETNPSFTFDAVDKVFALGAQLDLLRQNGAAQILSEPSVLCTNNKEAEIYVGQTQSILTQAQQSTQGQGNIVNNYSREDIGITLKVKPRLSSNNKVTLEVQTQIEDVLAGSGTAADRPTTTKRKVTTNAIVNNGETVILGGLIKKSTGKSKSRVPILGDIPVLGNLLFTSHADEDIETNVVIYLTPYIVRKSGDLQKLRTVLTELEEVQQKYNKIVFNQLEKKSGSRVPSASSSSTSTSASGRIKRTHQDNLDLLNKLNKEN